MRFSAFKKRLWARATFNRVAAGLVKLAWVGVFAFLSHPAKCDEVQSLFAFSGPTGHTLEDRSAASGYPKDVESLRQIETQVIEVAANRLPAVVEIKDGTGVVIDAEGLVLSQWHISHRGTESKPGQTIKVVLQGGQVRHAKLLGANLTNDISLLQMIEPGPYKFVPLGDSSALNLGDPVLKVGHPGGEDTSGRGAVLRFGRIVSCDQAALERGVFVTDCFTSGGDSGAPLFDLQGNLVAVIRSSPRAGVFPIACNEAAKRQPWPMAYTTTALVHENLAAMRDSQVLPVNQPELAKSHESLATAVRLPMDCWTQGSTSRQAYREVVQKVNRSVVEVRNGAGDVASLGVVVVPDGLVVTCSKTLPYQPQCRLPDGRIVEATIIGVSDEMEIALLELPSVVLKPIKWVDAESLPVGAFVAIAGRTKQPIATRVVSVACRKHPLTEKSFFEHDAKLLSNDLGGPVVGLDGNAIGLNVARTRYGCVAIGHPQIHRVISKLRQR